MTTQIYLNSTKEQQLTVLCNLPQLLSGKGGRIYENTVYTMYADIFSSCDVVCQSVFLDFNAFLGHCVPVQDVLVTFDPDQIDSFTFLQLSVPDAFPCLFQNIEIRVVCLRPCDGLTKSLPDSSSWPQSRSGLIGYLLPEQALVIIGLLVLLVILVIIDYNSLELVIIGYNWL